VTLQVMRWFGHIDDVDEWWNLRMVIEKVVRQSRLGYSDLRQYKFGYERFIFPPSNHSSFDSKFVSGWYLLYLQSDPISEDEFMTNGIPPSAILSFPTHPSSYSQ